MSLIIEYYGATWCKICVEIKPAVEKLSCDFGICFIDYDIDELEGDERVANIKKVPTVRIYNDNILIEEITTKHIDSIKNTILRLKKIVISDDF
jgi:thiol-disulfide isomerase/thioredoxin